MRQEGDCRKFEVSTVRCKDLVFFRFPIVVVVRTMRVVYFILIMTLLLPGCAAIHDYHYCMVHEFRACDAWRQSPDYVARRPATRDYSNGWKRGYFVVSTGGSCEPPVVPPQCYFSPKYQSPEGAEAIHQWYSGFQDGARAAVQSGAPNWHPVPSWTVMTSESHDHPPFEAPPADPSHVLPPPTPPAPMSRVFTPPTIHTAAVPILRLPDTDTSPDKSIDISPRPPVSMPTMASPIASNIGASLASQFAPPPVIISRSDVAGAKAVEPQEPELPPAGPTLVSWELRNTSPIPGMSTTSQGASGPEITSRTAASKATVADPQSDDAPMPPSKLAARKFESTPPIAAVTATKLADAGLPLSPKPAVITFATNVEPKADDVAPPDLKSARRKSAQTPNLAASGSESSTPRTKSPSRPVVTQAAAVGPRVE